jgi:coenzyme F420-0:L-glutamate ligase/coenzyme F420-1:gamma-L-glutamate ligase
VPFAPQLHIQSVPSIPLIRPGDDLAAILVACLHSAGIGLQHGDILVVTSKIVSKAEGRFLDLRTVTPSPRAHDIAAQTGKDPRLVEAALSESETISRMRMGVLITRHRLGFTSANAGIDHSNVGPNGEDWVLLLPVDPDQSAARLCAALGEASGARIGVVISDTHGRPFRLGNVGVAGRRHPALKTRGRNDLFGRTLVATDIALADELAAAADLLSGQAAEGLPVTLIRGLKVPPGESRARDLVRPLELDLYR